MTPDMTASDWVSGNGNWEAIDRASFRLKSDDSDWSWVEATDSEGAALRSLSNFLVQVTVSGNAAAAGISFGSFKDFLVPVDSGQGERLLQIEVDAQAGRWAFRADGRLMGRSWWDAAIESIGDILGGVLTLKAHKAEEVVFRDLNVRRFESSCRVSVILSCYRFAQRLHVALGSWCRQSLPAGAIEVIVANPESPDGTHEVIAAMASAFPEVRVRELSIDGGMARNKGFMLNRAIEASSGEWIWLTDADCVFPSNAVERALGQLDSKSALYYGERRQLGRVPTASLLAGRADASVDFERLAATAGAADSYPWGYTQIVHRSLAERIHYREDVDNFSTSDGEFLNACRARSVPFRRIDGLACLHLHHPFAWYGTHLYL
jgi:hypothetical protein